MTQSNNIDASGSGNITYAANGFSCSTQGANQWSYQSSADGSTWTNLSGCTTVNPLDQEWTTGGPVRWLCEQLRGVAPVDVDLVGSPVMERRRAPASVSIRGRVLMTDPTCASGVDRRDHQERLLNADLGPHRSIAAGDQVGADTERRRGQCQRR